MKDATFEECRVCPSRVEVVPSLFQCCKTFVCDCACGRATRNSGHPLAPCNMPPFDTDGCVISDFDEYDGQPFCAVDEESISEGHRCWAYINWLRLMDQHNGPDYRYPEGW